MNEISLPMPANCDHQRIDAFLESDHYRIEDDVLITHLDSCAACREYLESHAADPETWTRANSLLKTAAYDNAATAAYSAAGCHTQSGLQPHAIQDVLDALAPTDDPHRLGRIGTYEIAGVIGAGAMGVVLKAIDPALDRVIALKVMAPRLANNETARKRFAREAKAAAAVLHPNVIPIHSVSSDKALPYLVMAYIRGGSLQKRLEKEGALQIVEILRIGSQIAAGLAAAHEQGLVHRDIKPENILLEEGVERVTITDFGLARAVDDNTVTQMGVIAGTPMYMSPEQARGEQVDQQSDLFSLGSVLYALCTGQPPYRSDSSYGVMRRIIDESPAPIRKLNPAIPEWLACIVERLMAKEKSNRFATASEVHKLLDACLSHVQQPLVLPLPPILNLKPVNSPRSLLKSPKGVFTMLSTAAVVAFVYASFFMQPDRPSITTYGPTPGAPAKDASQQPAATPSLMIESHQVKGSAGDGKTQTHHWKLKGHSVGTMTVRVLHIDDGKARVVSESVYQGGTVGEQIIELEMRLQNTGEPMPFPGKTYIPALAVSVKGLQSKAQSSEKFVMEGEAETQGVTTVGQLAPEHILMHSAHLKGKIEYKKTLESMTEASKNGSSFLVTTVDWKSADQANNQRIDDLKNIQGTWQVTYSEDSGRVAPQEMLKNLKMVLSENKMTMQMGANKSESTFKLDPTTTPKSIDITEHGRTKQGIYDLQGDTLRICFAEQSKERPTQFDSKPDSANDVIIVMKRVAVAADKETKNAEPNQQGRINGAAADANIEMLENEIAYLKKMLEHPEQFPVVKDFTKEQLEAFRQRVKERESALQKAKQEAQQKVGDIQQIQGTWQVTKYDTSGRPAPRELLQKSQVVIADESMIMQLDAVKTTFGIKLNSSTSPKSIDMVYQGKVIKGIYELQGDTLRICNNELTNKRPTSFESKDNAEHVILVMERAKDNTAEGSKNNSQWPKENGPAAPQGDGNTGKDQQTIAADRAVSEALEQYKKLMALPPGIDPTLSIRSVPEPKAPEQKPVTKLADLKNGDYFIKVTQLASNLQVDFPNDVVPDKAYGPTDADFIKTIRLQIIEKGKQVRVIDHEHIFGSKVPVWTKTEAAEKWSYNNEEGVADNGMGKLALQQKDEGVIATFDSHGSGRPILWSVRGPLLEVNDKNRAMLEANAVKIVHLEDGKYEFKVKTVAENPGVKSIDSLIPHDFYKPVKQPTSFIVQISNKTNSVNLIDNSTPAKVGGKGLAKKDQPWVHLKVYETSGEGSEAGELVVEKEGTELTAFYKVSGPGVPVVASYWGTLVKVSKNFKPNAAE